MTRHYSMAQIESTGSKIADALGLGIAAASALTETLCQGLGAPGPWAMVAVSLKTAVGP